MGAEFKTKGINVALGPVVGPVGRVVLGGRNWEGFSNDPYLTGSLAAETIKGTQLSVSACNLYQSTTRTVLLILQRRQAFHRV